MIELYYAAFSAVNIIPTTLLLFVIAYWLLVIIGLFDISSFDIELDVDLEADVDMSADADVSVTWINDVLRFFNLNHVPVMVFATFWFLPAWIMSIMANHLIVNTSFLLSLLMLVGILFVCLFIAKPITIPFAKFFKKLDNEGESHKSLAGTFATVIMGATEERKGQADGFVNNSDFRLNIIADKGELKKGDKVLIIEFIEEKQVYLAELYDENK
jgi:hypothetical protein